MFRIVHVRGAIPNEMATTRCRATPSLTIQPTRFAPRPLRWLPSTEKKEEEFVTSDNWTCKHTSLSCTREVLIKCNLLKMNASRPRLCV